MFHKNRIHSVKVYESPEEMAKWLSEYSLTLCTGMQYKNTVWLNDSTGEDSLQEYAVCRYKDAETLEQMESITVSWCTKAELMMYIKWLAGEGPYVSDNGEEDWEIPVFYGTFQNRIAPFENHRCHLCA